MTPTWKKVTRAIRARNMIDMADAKPIRLELIPSVMID